MCGRSSGSIPGYARMVNIQFFLRLLRHPATWVSVVFLLIVLLLLPGRVGVPPEQTFLDDASQYHQAAVHVAREGFFSIDGVQPYAYREPGYSVFLGMVYIVAGIGNRAAIFLAQAALLLAAALFFASQLRHIGVSSRARTLFLALLLLQPSVFHVVFFVYRECFVLALMLLLAGALLQFHYSRSWSWAVACGVALAIISLTYLSFLFLPVALIAACWAYRWQPRFALAIIVLPYALVSLWGARNYAADGRFRLIDTDRTAVMWYVRGEQAQRVTGWEPARCLWAEYISRNWDGRSDACSFNSLMHAKWPQGKPLGTEDAIAQAGKAKIRSHFANYAWFSAWEVVEFHLPYVNGWGRLYNMLAAVGSLVLYAGCILWLPHALRRDMWLFPLIAGYTVAVFVLTDATPRYLMPVIFCYALVASVGYTEAFTRLRRHS